MERKFSFAPGEHYHIYARGVEKRNIFIVLRDYLRFQKLLYVANSTNPLDFKFIQGLPLKDIQRKETLVHIGAYCLMSNHFHLLLQEKTEGGTSRFMSKLMTAYSMYFNKRYERTGRLFQSTFKAKHADSDEYLRYLFCYIHLNPVKLVDENWREASANKLVGQKSFLREYQFSSYRDYLGIEREEAFILDRLKFPEYFSAPREFDDFINDWLVSRTTLEDALA